jgi:hypothetical protein
VVVLLVAEFVLKCWYGLEGVQLFDVVLEKICKYGTGMRS